MLVRHAGLERRPEERAPRAQEDRARRRTRRETPPASRGAPPAAIVSAAQRTIARRLFVVREPRQRERDDAVDEVGDALHPAETVRGGAELLGAVRERPERDVHAQVADERAGDEPAGSRLTRRLRWAPNAVETLLVWDPWRRPDRRPSGLHALRMLGERRAQAGVGPNAALILARAGLMACGPATDVVLLLSEWHWEGSGLPHGSPRWCNAGAQASACSREVRGPKPGRASPAHPRRTKSPAGNPRRESTALGAQRSRRVPDRVDRDVGEERRHPDRMHAEQRAAPEVPPVGQVRKERARAGTRPTSPRGTTRGRATSTAIAARAQRAGVRRQVPDEARDRVEADEGQRPPSRAGSAASTAAGRTRAT